MSYNLLLDTKFKTPYNWKYINCEYKDGKLISTSKVFGVMQELILPDPTKLYLRSTYKVLTPSIKEVKIGIQNKDELSVNNKVPRYNKEQRISVICKALQEKIQVHLIFESDKDINEVEIKEPLLVDLVYLNKSTWLKLILDRTTHYIDGYTYKNEYEISEIKPNKADFKNVELHPAKIGSIIKLTNSKEIEISAKFIINKYYLVKLDFEEINKFGSIYFKYGVIKSTIINEQLYLVFRANTSNTLKLVIEANDVLPYQVNLKHILLIDITTLNLLKVDIPYLPFI